MLLTVHIHSRQMRRIAVRGTSRRGSESDSVLCCPDMRVLAAAHTEVGPCFDKRPSCWVALA